MFLKHTVLSANHESAGYLSASPPHSGSQRAGSLCACPPLRPEPGWAAGLPVTLMTELLLLLGALEGGWLHAGLQCAVGSAVWGGHPLQQTNCGLVEFIRLSCCVPPVLRPLAPAPPLSLLAVPASVPPFKPWAPRWRSFSLVGWWPFSPAHLPSQTFPGVMRCK